ncbi:MAG: GH3 auxin-responsive promoter family protein [Candidatus Aureabacteria bacterium]|nr:GH3 auxin-responsive promoter family protein [Candidatus Auribacterota bacterium]
MNIVSYIIKAIGHKDALRFEASTSEPASTQDLLLKKIISANSNTSFGKKHGFGSISDAGQYQSKVPVFKYDGLLPFIEKSLKGETNILTAENPIFFATTSGTTGKPKYIPVTQSSRNAKSMVMRLWMYYASRKHPDIFNGKILSVVSPEAESYTEKGIPCGAESGHAYKNMPAVMKKNYSVPYDVFAMDDYKSKYYILLRLALQENISFIGTCNPSTILLLCQKTTEHAPELIRDLYEGTCAMLKESGKNLRARIMPYLKKDRARAKHLEDIMDSAGSLSPAGAWPSLALIGCWLGGSVGIYLRDFSKYFSKETPLRDWGYLASELRGSIPIEDNTPAGILAIETNYYEFLDEADADSGKKRFLTVSQLKKGGRYFVYPTTLAGLYRYEMNDIIEVADFYNRTPVIKFCQKGKGVSSITGEKLYESQVVEAVSRSLEKNRLHLEFIVATIDTENLPKYVFIVEETTDKINEEAGLALISDIDAFLRKINIEYDSKRKSSRLDRPVLKIAERGSYDTYRKKKVSEGVPDGQFKMLKLNSDPGFQENFKTVRTL